MMKFISGFVVLAVLMFSANTAHAQSQWANLSKSMFPAKVESITLQSGNVIDGVGNYVSWGKWSVQFGPEVPIARYMPCAGSACRGASYPRGAAGVRIKNLECANDVEGIMPCDMILQKYSPGDASLLGHEYSCRIWVDTIHMPDREYFDIDIKCPASVELQ